MTGSENPITIRLVKEITSKGSSEPFFLSMYFFRKFTPYFTYTALKFKLSANTVTFISLIFAVVGALLHIFQENYYTLLGSAFLLFYIILDHVDGEVARVNRIVYSKNTGLSGGYFDALVHYIFNPILFLGIGFAAFNEFDQPAFIFMGLIVGMWQSGYGQAAMLRIIMDYYHSKNKMPEIFSNELHTHDKIDWQKDSLNKRLRFIYKEIFSQQSIIIYLFLIGILESRFMMFDLSLRYVLFIMLFSVGLLSMIRGYYFYFSVLRRIQ